MNHKSFVLLFLLVAGIAGAASNAALVAVPEFQNDSGKLVLLNRWDLAAWMSNELKRTDEFKPLDRKVVGAAIKDAEWNENRLSRSAEAKLLELSAKYVFYGTISEWHLESSVVSRRVADSRAAETGPPGVTVIFAIRMVDLTTLETVKEFLVDGNALGQAEASQYGEPPYLDTDARFSPLFEEACKQAFRKAARLVAKKD